MDPARDTITIYLMGEIKDVCDDGKGKGIMRACGSQLPPFTSDVTCDAYQLEFADAIWDKPDMPTFETVGSTSGFDPGAILSIAQVAGLVGIKLNAGAAFPTSTETGTFACEGAMGLGCFPDQDGDGFPGVTVSLKTGSEYKPSGCGLGGANAYTYRGSPTSLDVGAAGGTGSGVRAAQVHVGLSTMLGGAGTIAADCASGKGDAMAPEDAIKSRVASCKVDPASLPSGDTAHANNDCDSTEAQFVDDNVPNYHVLQKDEMPPAGSMLNWPLSKAGSELMPATASKGPLSAVVRLGDLGGTFTCADVRAAAFP